MDQTTTDNPSVASQQPRSASSIPLSVATPDADLAPSLSSMDGLLEVLRTYLSDRDIQRVRDAYRFADNAHLGQFRNSGEAYIGHPIAVAGICAQWRLDADALMAALLHDVLEDTGTTKAELAERFGLPVAELVDGLSKLDKISFSSREQAQAESFRKMLLAMARDVRVILIKLADRCHNMRTLDAVGRSRQRRIANETMEIYAPIANRLGLNSLFRELQDLSFRHLHPMRYATLAKAVRVAGRTRRDALGRVMETIQRSLERMGVKAELSGREKTLYSVYRKMQAKRISFSEVSDLFGIRLIVQDIPQCYLALGAMHGSFKPNTSRFKDFIAIPKVNGYQSLHTTVVGPHGGPIEFQIRTAEMHRTAEAGVAAHWLYKSEEETSSDIQAKTMNWLKSLLDIQQQTGDSLEFIDHVKVDLYPDAVYVFTPKGQIRALPRGATVVDFAYSVHTELANRCVACRINGDLVPLRSELSHGDVVEIITDENARPNPSWIAFARTGKARSEIRYFLRRMKYGESVALGRRLLEQALASLRIDLMALDAGLLEKIARGSAAKSVDDMMADIGLGMRLAPVVARSVSLEIAGPAAKTPYAPRPLPILISSVDGISVHCAPCCHPLPGDRAIGHMRGGHGLSIHRTDCETAKRQMRRDAERWLEVDWDEEITGMFRTNIEVSATNDLGALGKIAGEVAAQDANIAQVVMDTDPDGSAMLRLTLQVRDRDHLAAVFRSLRRLPNVLNVTRSGPRPVGETDELPSLVPPSS